MKLIDIKAFLSASVPIVAALWWVFGNVVLSEDLAAFQKQTDYKIDNLGIQLRIDDIQYKLFELRLMPATDRTDYERALIGRLQDDLDRWQRREETINQDED